MKAFINDLEISFKDLGEPQVTFEGETYEVIAEVVKEGTKPKKVKDPFMLTIEAYLQQRASEDELFAETLKKPAKSIEKCVDYIYSEVKKTGRQGFTDDEVFGMAVHYYDEDSITVPANVQKPKTIVNTAIAAPSPVELSAEDKEKARKLALDRAIAKEADRLATKKKASTTAVKSTETQQSLF